MTIEKEYLTPKEASKISGVHTMTLRRWAESGVLDYIRISNGDRRYDKQSLYELLNIPVNDNKKTVFYIRSSNGNKKLMQSQEDLLTTKFGAPDKVYKDKASGLNEKRRGLQALLRDVKKGEISTICITSQDRLTRFGYSYLEDLCSIFHTRIEVLNANDQKSMHEELMDDFMSLIASFSGKYYRLRSNENKKKFMDKANETFKKSLGKND